MHTVLRQSGRLCTRVSKRRIQRFSYSASQQHPDSRPEDRDRTKKHDSTNKVTKEQDNTEDTAEGVEGRRSGFRRISRQRKPADIPKPPALPAWFLKRNVVLQARSKDEESKDTDYEVIECVDIDSGKTLFTLSCSADAASELISEGAGKTAKDNNPRAAAVRVVGGSISRQDGATSIRLTDARAATIKAEAIIHATFSLAGLNLPTFVASKAELSLQTSDPQGHAFMDRYVGNLASSTGADLVRIDANDLADLTEEYVGQGTDSPGTFSTLAHEVFEDQVAFASITRSAVIPGPRNPSEEEENEQDEEEEEEDEDESEEQGNNSNAHKFKSIQDLLKSQIGNLESGLSRVPVAFSFAIPAGAMSGGTGSRQTRKKSSTESDFVQWDDARLAAVLEQLIDAPQAKREAGPSDVASTALRSTTSPLFAKMMKSISKHSSETSEFRRASAVPPQAADAVRKTIVHVRDLNNLCGSKLGEAIVTRLAKVVQKRRRLGEQIMIVGTSTSINRSAAEIDESPFVSLVIPSRAEGVRDIDIDKSKLLTQESSGYHRILEINMRNIASMLRRLQPDQAPEEIFSICQHPMFTPRISTLGDQILSQETVHQLVLTAVGLAQSYARSDTVQAFHIALAATLLASADQTPAKMARAIQDRLRARFSANEGATKTVGASGRERLEQIKQNCNSHETRLLTGVVDAQNIRTGFDDVHVAPETIEALKTLTTLSLLRPDAFKYGVLAKDNLSGLMLYGPPGTGKTLLAKAVAKESKATVLEVSGAQVYEKYVGEGEKMVRAVFTLAKKLSPCVVFIDEADALFGTRNSASNRSTHRELINQFLREWDGMDDHKVFIMVATNRPFDVDDAVLRRLPRRILIDLPVAKDRENILGIHLRDEALDPAVALPALAAQTPLYSGSDLKNLCVATALAAVREENDVAAQHTDDKDFKLPEKRTLHQRHFDKGLQEISASISEDMSSLNAIRKFDEQYGDRKGRRKRASYGFGALDAPVDENAARVRQGL